MGAKLEKASKKGETALIKLPHLFMFVIVFRFPFRAYESEQMQ